MDPRQLLALLQHILVWIPPNNPIRTEIQQHITNIKTQLAQQQQ